MNQIKAGAVLNYIIIGLNMLVGLLYTPYMLRCLGQNEYGLYSLVASVIAYLTLLDFGFGPTVVRYTAKYRAEGKTEEQYSLFGLFIVLYSIIGIIAFTLGLLLYFNVGWLFDHTMTPSDIAQAKVMIILLLFNLALTFPMSVFGSIITAYENFIFQKVVNILRILLSTGVMIALLSLGYKAIAMVVVQTVFNVTVLLLNLAYCINRLKIKIKFGRINLRFVAELLSFSVWVFLGDVMFKFYYSTGQFVLGATTGTTAIAVFALGVTLMQMYIMFSGGISGVLLPRITSMVAKDSSDHDIADMFIRVGRLQFFVMSLILSGFIVFGKQFISFWAGAGYEDVYIICIIFFFSTLVPLIQNTAIVILQARNQQKVRALILLIVSALSLLAQIILAKEYGARGCAVAIGVANIVGQGIVLNYYYHRYQHLEIIRFWKEIFSMSLLPILLTVIGVMAVSQFEISNIASLITSIILYAIIFVPITFILTLNNSEKKLFTSPILRIISRMRSHLDETR